MHVLECRYTMLQQLVAAIGITDIPFIGMHQGSLIPCGVSDDLGSFFCIPWLVKTAGISLDQAILLFYGTLIGAGVLLALLGFWLLYANWVARAVALFGVLRVAHISYELGDVYIAYSTAVLATVPLSLYLFGDTTVHKKQYLSAFMFGIIIGFCNAVRAHAGLAPLIFMGVLLASKNEWGMRNRLALVFLLGLGTVVPTAFFNYQFKRYEQSARQSIPAFLQIPDRHVFWHTVYLGFGYLSNEFGIKWDDGMGMQKALSIDPVAVYPSVRYEEVIKQETFKLVKEHFGFVLRTIFAKLGVIFFFLLWYGLPGLIAAWYFPKMLALEVAFWSALAASSLFALIGIPYREYLLGFIALTLLYLVVSVNYALSCGVIERLRRGVLLWMR